jgi:glycosyltransferase involved in cell wall biosynthesis
VPRSRPAPALLVVLKGYPRVSETFIAHELAALERRGVALAIASLRRPYDPISHPVHAAIRAPVAYLPEYLLEAPGRVLRGHARALMRAPGRYLRALAGWLGDLARDPTPNRVRRFGQAGVLAAEVPPTVRHLHAHFLHTPASVARYAARMTGLPLSLSGHAKDLWQTPGWELGAKLRAARFTAVCTASGRDRLRGLAPEARVALVHHGLDRTLFRPPATFGSARDGRDATDPVRLLAVGRFQPKKGLDVLLAALPRVRRHVHLTVVGYGPLEAALRAQAERLGVAARVTWTGPLDQPAVRALYRASDLLVASARVAPDADRDGLPNVVLEALSQGLPVIGTRVAAIPEAIEDGVHGRLVPPEDPAALAAAIEALAGDPAARRAYGANGLRRLAREFDLEEAADRLLALFAEAGFRPLPGAPGAERARPGPLSAAAPRAGPGGAGPAPA